MSSSLIEVLEHSARPRRHAALGHFAFFLNRFTRSLQSKMATFKLFTGTCAPLLCRNTAMQGAALPNLQFAAASSRRSLFQSAAKRSISNHAGRPQPSLKTPFQQRWRRNASFLTDNQVIQRPADSGAKWTRIAATTAVIVGGAGCVMLTALIRLRLYTDESLQQCHQHVQQSRDTGCPYTVRKKLPQSDVYISRNRIRHSCSIVVWTT